MVGIGLLAAKAGIPLVGMLLEIQGECAAAVFHVDRAVSVRVTGDKAWRTG
jgi:hypothetical protein